MGIETIQAEAQSLVDGVNRDIEQTEAEKKTKIKELDELIKSFDDKIEGLKKTRKRFQDIIAVSNTDLSTLLKKEKAKEAQKAWKEKQEKKEEPTTPKTKGPRKEKEVEEKDLADELLPKKKMGRPKKQLVTERVSQ